MIVWGGIESGFVPYLNTGARYEPATDTWSATNSAAGAAPAGRIFHTAIWTGTEMIVWGGQTGTGTRLNSGGRYNPAGDSWTPTGTGANLPAVRAGHTATWTRTEMIVWGGVDSSSLSLSSGGRYDSASDAWTPTGGGPNLPAARTGHTATWTGDRMFVWGGSAGSSGGRYDPVSNSWAAVSTANAPLSPEGHTAVWTGSEVIVWGSTSGNTGGRYNPTSNAWTATSTGSGVPAGRVYHSAVWANGEMIIWGGYRPSTFPNGTSTGGRYDPANNTWAPTGTGDERPVTPIPFSGGLDRHRNARVGRLRSVCSRDRGPLLPAVRDFL